MHDMRTPSEIYHESLPAAIDAETVYGRFLFNYLFFKTRNN